MSPGTDTGMNSAPVKKAVLVLAVPHQLQGMGFIGYVNDPSYRTFVEDLVSEGRDFVFEEAAGQKPSHAEEIADAVLGAGHYLDVDPSDRAACGISAKTGGREPVDEFARVAPGTIGDTYEFSIVSEQEKREAYWARMITSQDFKNGLAICGLCHGLSLAFRLESAGIDVSKAFSYIPWHKLR